LDKLDGEITEDFYQEKRKQWRAEQNKINEKIKIFQRVEDNYFDSGIKIIELARRAREYYSNQNSIEERRKSLELLIERAKWANNELYIEFKKPFSFTIHSNSQIIDMKKE